MTALLERNTHFDKWIPLSRLVIAWPDAQRPYQESQAKAIAAAFDPDLFGSITVTQLSDGRYHVCDGWHRVNAARMALGADQVVPCTVVTAGTKKQAAHIFLGINRPRRSVTALEKFLVGVTADDPIDAAINRLVLSLGFKIDRSSSSGTIRAVACLRWIFSRYGAGHLADVILCIRGTYGMEPEAYDASILRGYAIFLAAYGETVDRDRLAKKVAKDFSPTRLIGTAKSIREGAKGRDVPHAISQLILRSYNSAIHSASRRLVEIANEGAAIETPAAAPRRRANAGVRGHAIAGRA